MVISFKVREPEVIVWRFQKFPRHQVARPNPTNSPRVHEVANGARWDFTTSIGDSLWLVEKGSTKKISIKGEDISNKVTNHQVVRFKKEIKTTDVFFFRAVLHVLQPGLFFTATLFWESQQDEKPSDLMMLLHFELSFRGIAEGKPSPIRRKNPPNLRFGDGNF